MGRNDVLRSLWKTVSSNVLECAGIKLFAASQDVGSIAIDDGGFGGPNYSEDLNFKIDQAIKDAWPLLAWTCW